MHDLALSNTLSIIGLIHWHSQFGFVYALNEKFEGECLGNVSVCPLNAGWGRIINIASSHGLVASPNKAAYVASKFGLNGLTKVGFIAICSLKLK